MTAKPRSFLVADAHTPDRARFPAADAHNHLWSDLEVDRIVETMDAVGVSAYCNLTANAGIEFTGGGYTIGPRDIESFLDGPVADYPGRFYGFTMADFARPPGTPLFSDAERFARDCSRTLRNHVALGAKGLKVLKELGLSHRDTDGELIRVDDERLSEIWETAAELGVPVLIHQSDPFGFFEPVAPVNEHFETLAKFPSWSFADPIFPRKLELLERRDNVIRRHSHTTFILPHVANFAENLPYVSRLLDENPNVYLDFSARLDELGRRPYSAREFFLRHRERLVFGTDMPANIDTSIDMYRCYFRFLETYDEGFYAPDYDGTFDRARWTICGIGLPDDVLEDIYYKNIVRLIPALTTAPFGGSNQ